MQKQCNDSAVFILLGLMKLPLFVFLAAAFLGACATSETPPLPAAGPLPETDQSTIGYATVAEALDALRKKPTAQFRENRGWTVVEDREQENKTSTLWSFTPPGHPAHPAVAKRTVYEKDGVVWIDLNVHCEASKEACDQLVRDFQTLNDRIKQEMGKSK